MSRAAIDIGSHSLLLTVVDDTGVVLHDEARVVGLGRGLGERGLFAPDRIAAAELALTDYLQIARSFGVEPRSIKAVATSGARRAMNAETWLARVRRKLGLRVRVISGEEEARLTWLGATAQLDLPHPLLVVDLGGGSTELVLGTERGQARCSLEIGSVRLTEAFLGTQQVDPANLAKCRNRVDSELSAVSLSPMPRSVIGVAGTVTTLATIALGLSHYDATKVQGSRLTRTHLANAIDALLPATPAQRRALAPASPERADYLLAGCVILDRVLAVSRRQHLVVSDQGIRYGLLHEG